MLRRFYAYIQIHTRIYYVITNNNNNGTTLDGEGENGVKKEKKGKDRRRSETRTFRDGNI